MTQQEEKIWQYLLKNRSATQEEVVVATGATSTEVDICFRKIGTLEAVWRGKQSDEYVRMAIDQGEIEG